jgi:hypothetical protein
MGLRVEHEAALAETLEDPDLYGWPITVTDPSGASVSLYGSSTDIQQVIDPETGQAVTGRLASVAVRLSTLYAAGLGIPRAIASASSKPWRVDFNDINGLSYNFKVRESAPDRAFGLVLLTLETYKP